MRLPEESQECRSKEIPIELSMSGHNSFYHQCENANGRTSYSVCQHTIAAIERGATVTRPGCVRAYERAECPALKMRAAEREAGRALFYTDRRAAFANASKNTGNVTSMSFGKRSRPLQASKFGGSSITSGISFGSGSGSGKPKKAKSADDGFTFNPGAGNFLADVVNNLAKKESTES